ncbi:MAG: hypothetical protein QNJ65_14940 [Xenococcaceae cyanobacterium MO_234.B1]|nr:hypothetical protein [Xenococcaceae cyanobacterium MO_234.B1]
MLLKQSVILVMAIAAWAVVGTSNAEIASSQTQSSVTNRSISTQRYLPRRSRTLLRDLINWRTLIPRREYNQPTTLKCRQSHSSHQSNSTNSSRTTISQSRSSSTITTCHN